MEYRRFGRTELAMPVFSCGGMRYQYQWQDTSEDKIPLDNQQNLEATIEQALALGINHIETYLNWPCKITVQPAPEPVYIEIRNKAGQLEESFFIRTGNSTSKLDKPSEISSYIKNRWKA